MGIRKQYIVIRIAPASNPETRIANLPFVEFASVDEAAGFLKQNSLLPAEAELEEQNLIVSWLPEDDDGFGGDQEGCYLIFTAGDIHYHVIVKDVIM
jgi:hypothetical protein